MNFYLEIIIIMLLAFVVLFYTKSAPHGVLGCFLEKSS